MLPLSWKLFKVWRKVEAPARAPPVTEEIIQSMVMYASAHSNLMLAALLCLGFYVLLRTGELLQITPQDLIIQGSAGVFSWKKTKSGLPSAAHETVSLTHPLAHTLSAQPARYRQNEG